MNKVIEVTDLKKNFITPLTRKTVPALKGLNFSIEEGSVVGFLGANGAGKTTTLKVLLGLIKKDSGSFKILDKEEIGFLTERPYFYEYLTGYEFLDFCSKLFKKQATKKRINDLIAEVGLSHAAHRPLRNYSKGMLQRIGLAQALVNEPKLLILDEPMSGLDPDGRSDIMHLIKKSHTNGATVFFSTHLISDIETFCTEVVIINHGKLVVQSKVSELLSKYTKGFILETRDSKNQFQEYNFSTEPELQRAIDGFRKENKIITRVETLRPNLEEVFIKMKNESEIK